MIHSSRSFVRHLCNHECSSLHCKTQLEDHVDEWMTDHSFNSESSFPKFRMKVAVIRMLRVVKLWPTHSSVLFLMGSIFRTKSVCSFMMATHCFWLLNVDDDGGYQSIRKSSISVSFRLTRFPYHGLVFSSSRRVWNCWYLISCILMVITTTTGRRRSSLLFFFPPREVEDDPLNLNHIIILCRFAAQNTVN